MSDDELSADALRRSLESWLAEHLTPEVAAAGNGMPTAANLELLRSWNRALADAGWAAPAWPREFGGLAAGIDEQMAYLEVMSRAGAPGPVNSIGVANIAPAIMQYGSDEQQSRFLGPLLRGDEIWSQGMSEPDAGSDLASLRTSAVLDGDSFVINGQEDLEQPRPVSPTGASSTCARIRPRRSTGASAACWSTSAPKGIEVRPIRSITGSSSFSELFFSEVRVPQGALLGPLDQGWTVAMTTLSYERAGVARLHLMLSKRLSELLAEPAVVAALADPRFRDRVAEVHADIACMRWMTDRSLAQQRQGQPAGATGSLTKLAWARADQKLAALAVDLLGAGAMVEGKWPTKPGLGPPDLDRRWHHRDQPEHRGGARARAPTGTVRPRLSGPVFTLGR